MRVTHNLNSSQDAYQIHDERMTWRSIELTNRILIFLLAIL